MSTRRNAIAAGAIVLAMILSGCSAVSNIWAAMDTSGEITFALCDQVDAAEIRVRIQGDDGPAWVSAGSHDFAEGDRFTYGTDPDGFDSTSGPLPIASSDTVVVSVLPGESRSEDSARAEFKVADISSDDWLSADGRRSPNPCS